MTLDVNVQPPFFFSIGGLQIKKTATSVCWGMRSTLRIFIIGVASVATNKPACVATDSDPFAEMGNKELPRDYIARFNEQALLVEDYDNKMALSAMFSDLKEGKFTFSIGKNSLTTLAELINRVQKYTNAEEFFNTRRNIQVSNKKPDDRAPRDRWPSRRPEGKFRSYTPLNTSAEQILLDIRGQRLLNWPVCMKTNAENRDKSKYCRFHRDYGHNTSDCVDLKDEIETLIHNGHLCQYIKEKKLGRKEERLSKTVEEPAEIRTIYGGSSSGGDLNRARKSHLQSLDPEHYVYLTERPRKELRLSPCSLTFIENDACRIQHPHDDALVVAMTIANHKVFRILVNTGSSVDVIYSEAFESMSINRLNVDTDHKLVKQKRRAFDAERYTAIADEVSNLLSVGFIEEIHYPDWIANVVPVKKASGKWRSVSTTRI
ncbi:uncharacterized protein LOC131246898 [Magnolia sinica]|uniref:uncharacterized protein LOC131246898 n=1 Tax=Magnolia sinica TaxID=86752 RepID=UPI002659E321|nr:uncharacterized protein LOC131246898 [Magnolia sinica]